MAAAAAALTLDDGERLWFAPAEVPTLRLLLLPMLWGAIRLLLLFESDGDRPLLFFDMDDGERPLLLRFKLILLRLFHPLFRRLLLRLLDR